MAKPAKTDAPASNATRTIVVNEQDFVTTRNAFVTHLYQLGNAVQKTLEAYTIHTEAVLGGRVKYDEVHVRRLVEAAVASTHALIGPPEEDGKRKRRKREPRPLGMPKRPNTAFFRFQLEVRPAYRARNEDKSPGEIENLMKDAWNAMSEAQKQPYKDAYKAERLQYDEEFNAWKQAGGAAGYAAAAAGVVGDESDDESSSSDSDSEEDQAPLPPPAKKTKAGRPSKTKKGAIDPSLVSPPQAVGAPAAFMGVPQGMVPIDPAVGSPGKTKAKAGRKPKVPVAGEVPATMTAPAAVKPRKRKNDVVA